MTFHTFSDFLTSTILSEELHPELKQELDKNRKYSSDGVASFSKKVKAIQNRGEETGLDGTKHSGSSRVYYPHAGTHEINLDGKSAHVPVGTKFAKRFALDKHTGIKKSLGSEQNRAEVDAARHYGLFHKHEDGSFSTNPNGVVAPTIDHHGEHEHITSVKAEKFSTKKFKDTTKSESHPKGLPFKHFTATLLRHHDRSNGKYYNHYGVSHEDMDKAEDHPLVHKFMAHQDDTGHHPGDIRSANMGHITHPHTGEVHHVLVDAGYDHEVQNLYAKARTKMYSR
jgi:hypothetical protein